MNDPVIVKASEVIVIEHLDEDGERSLVIAYSEGVKDWETRGLLCEVLSDLDAHNVREWLGD